MSTSLTRAGAETQVCRIAVELSRRGWTVSVISMLPPNAFEAELAAADVTVASLDMTRGVPDPRALPACTGLLRSWRPDVLLTYMLHANLLGRLSAVLARVPAVISSVRTEFFGGRAWDFAMGMTDRFSAATVTNSALVAEQLVRRRAVSAHRIRVIPNGVRVGDFAPSLAACRAVRSELGVADDEFLWLCAARLEPQKDHRNLLDAFARVVAEVPESRLCLAGRGPERQALEGRAGALGIADRVGFLGLREDVPELLSAADALVLSSAWEGLPNIIIEALAAGVPVVATDVGGVSELIRDSETGLLVPARDPGALAARMLDLLALPTEDRRVLGVAGQQLVRERLELGQVVDQWEDLFHQCRAVRL